MKMNEAIEALGNLKECLSAESDRDDCQPIIDYLKSLPDIDNCVIQPFEHEEPRVLTADQLEGEVLFTGRLHDDERALKYLRTRGGDVFLVTALDVSRSNHPPSEIHVTEILHPKPDGQPKEDPKKLADVDVDVMCIDEVGDPCWRFGNFEVVQADGLTPSDCPENTRITRVLGKLKTAVTIIDGEVQEQSEGV